MNWDGQLWDEYGVEICAEILKSTTREERFALYKVATDRDMAWNIRLLSLVCSGDRNEAVEVAHALLSSTDDELMLRAADTLRSFDAKAVLVPSGVEERMRFMAANGLSRIDQIRATEFLRMIGAHEFEV